MPFGIEAENIAFFQKMVALTLKKTVTKTEMSTLLVLIGDMDAWPQLKRLEEMETVIRSPDFIQEDNQAFIESFLHLVVVVKDKIFLASLELQNDSDPL